MREWDLELGKRLVLGRRESVREYRMFTDVGDFVGVLVGSGGSYFMVFVF